MKLKILLIFILLICFSSFINCQANKSTSTKSSVSYGKDENGETIDQFYAIGLIKKGDLIISVGYKLNKTTSLSRLYDFIIYSSKNGKNWVELDVQSISSRLTLATNYWQDPHMVQRQVYLSADEKHFYLSYKGGYYRSTDGLDWEIHKDNNDDLENTLTYVIDNTLRVILYTFGREHNAISEIYRNTNNNWKKIDLPSQRNGTFPLGMVYEGDRSFPVNYGGNNYFSKEPKLESEYPVDKRLYSVISPSSNSTVMYGLAAKNYLWRSTDGGLSFQYLDQIQEKYTGIERIFPICSDGTIFISTNKMSDHHISDLYYSSDQGTTWNAIKGVYIPRAYGQMIHLNDGSSVLGVKGLLHLESSCGKTTNNKDKNKTLDYGTTIITHGILVDDYYPSDGGWMDRMATAILKKANFGRIYFYKKETGEFIKLIETGTEEKGEDIILFDWSDEALEFGNGSTEAAADALFAALNIGEQKQLFNLKNLHFIGHGRGAIVNSLTVERFYQNFIPKVAGEKTAKEVSIGQVTNLGPFDSGHTAWWEPGDIKFNALPDDLNDAHPEIQINTPELHQPNNGVIAWKGIYSDTYWQNNGKLYLDNLLGSVLPTKEKLLDKAIIDLTDLIDYKRNKELIDGLKVLMEQKISDKERSKRFNELVKNNPQINKLKKAFKAIKVINFIIALKDVVYSNLKEREVEGCSNFNWKKYNDKVVIHPTYKSKSMLPIDWLKEYIGICDAYTKSIEESKFDVFDEQNGGFSISRLNGFKITPSFSNSFGNRTYLPNLNYFENLKIPGQEESRVRGIINGSFDRVMGSFFPEAPGWAFHGGGREGNVIFSNDMAILELSGNDKSSLKHNRFYIPENAKSISFDLKKEPNSKGKVVFEIEDIDSKTKKQYEFFISDEFEDFKSILVPVESFLNRVVTFEFVYSMESKSDTHALFPSHIVYIDNVKLSKEETNRIEEISFNNVNKQRKMITDGDSENESKTTSSNSLKNEDQVNSNQENSYSPNNKLEQNILKNNPAEEKENNALPNKIDEQKEDIKERRKAENNSVSKVKYNDSPNGLSLFDRSQILVNFNTGYRIARGTHFDLSLGSIVNNDKNIFLGVGLLYHSFDDSQQSMIGIYASTKISLGYSFLTSNEFENDASVYFIGDFGYSNTLDRSARLRGGFFTNIGLGYPLYIYKNAYLDSGITWRRLNGSRNTSIGYIDDVFNSLDIRVGIAVYLGR